ncbi:hypothetical protein SBA4_6070013 [Candidatus Sulfopaludibacter sp. SbA4]|nr:hypothetical protein SBA4_6070013 [Candidatus Sulfopaludibacter sp. SbA4]
MRASTFRWPVEHRSTQPASFQDHERIAGLCLSGLFRLTYCGAEPGSDVVTAPARSLAFPVGGLRSYTSDTSCLAPGTN